HLNELNGYTWSVVKELNFANEFIKYLLKKLIGKDLTNLINGIYLIPFDSDKLKRCSIDLLT
ncbi:21169_t:CDS:1, partial [Racocetra persica]